MTFAHTAMPLSYCMHHSLCLPAELVSATIKPGNYRSREKRPASLNFGDVSVRTAAGCFLQSLDTRYCQLLST